MPLKCSGIINIREMDNVHLFLNRLGTVLFRDHIFDTTFMLEEEHRPMLIQFLQNHDYRRVQFYD